GQCLAGFGPSGLTALMKALQGPERTARRHALTGLWALGSRVESLSRADRASATSAAVKQLDDSSAEMRLNAVMAIGTIGGDLPEAVRSLVAALKDEDDKTRRAAENA